MLLPNMSKEEITSEVLRDFNEIHPRTIDRLTDEFVKVLKKNKIPKSQEYHKIYQIKSKKKNPWVLIYSQDIFDKQAVRVVIFTYYYTDKGLRVFEVGEDMKTLVVYNGHLFQRYNERMKLNLSGALESAKRFFINNSQRVISTSLKDDRVNTVEMCKDGIVFGEIQGSWLISKTFISKDLARTKQNELEFRMIEAIIQDLKMQNLLTGKTNSDLNFLLEKLLNKTNDTTTKGA